VRDGVDPADVECRVQWADPSTRSQAQEADAVTKLYAANIISRVTALEKLGFSEEEIAADIARKRGEVANETEMGVYFGRQATDMVGTNPEE